MALNAAEKARIAGRKEAVKAGVAKGQSAKESRKRYYVETRIGEMKAKGKTVTPELRKQLREKFNSGDVSRKGFAAPKKKVSSSSSSSSPVISGTPTAPSSKGRSATSNMKGVSGYKAGTSKPSSKVSKVAKKKSSGGVLGALKGFAGKIDRVAGKVGNFANNELLGFDDIKRYDKYMGSGEYGKAAKSLGAAYLEAGSTIGSAGAGALASGGSKGVVASTKGGLSAIKAARAAKLAKASRIGAKGTSPVGSITGRSAARLARSIDVPGNYGGVAGRSLIKGGVKKVAPKVAKRVPRVAKTVSKPMVKSTSKPLTSKAVVRKSISKPLAKKVSKPVAKTTRPRNYSKSTGKPFTAKQEAAFKKEYSRVNKNASAVRQRREAARKFPG